MGLRQSGTCHHEGRSSHYRSDVPSHSKSSANPLARMSPRQLAVLAAIVVVIIGGVVGALVASGGSGKKPSAATTPSTLPPPATTQPKLAKDICPLTDVRDPNGKVPQRAPIAVKIGNEPGPGAGGLGAARPQSGLNEADIVYDTPAEGGIMRYEAIYQCQNASSVGPVRSIRWVDTRILAEFRHSILAHVGGIEPNIAYLNSLSYVGNADDDCVNEKVCDSQDFVQSSSRVPPDATYTSTSKLWSTFNQAEYHHAPSPVFRYSASLPSSASPVKQVEIKFSQGTDAIWQWSATKGEFLHFWGSTATPDIDQLDHQQVATTNIFIQIVKYQIGPYEETSGIASSGDVESQTVGSGKGWILRNGKMIAVTWHRASLQDPTTFTDAAGKAIGLAPGRTWVEMVINTTANQPGAITFTK